MPLLTTGAGKYPAAAVASGNLLLQPRALEHAAWTRNNIGSITANATTSYDATTSAELIIEALDAATYHYIEQSVVKAASSIVYTLSVYAKLYADPRQRLILQLDDGGTGGYNTIYDIAGGLADGGAVSGYGSGWSGGSKNLTGPHGTGWYKCTLTATSSALTTVRGLFMLDAGSGTGGYAGQYSGNGTSGMYLDLAELTV